MMRTYTVWKYVQCTGQQMGNHLIDGIFPFMQTKHHYTTTECIPHLVEFRFFVYIYCVEYWLLLLTLRRK